jgi:hypothetical protein
MNGLTLRLAIAAGAAVLVAIPAGARADGTPGFVAPSIERSAAAPLVRNADWDANDPRWREREYERWEAHRREEARARWWRYHHHEEYGYAYPR